MPSKKEKLPLSVTHPELAKEAAGWDPGTVTAGSSKKLNWQCRYSHTYGAVVQKRALRGYGCPICSNRKILIGVNDLATTHPLIAQEADGWNPTSVVAGSPQEKKWKCPKGHNWKALIVSRTRGKGTNCPTCSNRNVAEGFNDLNTKFPEIAKQAYGWNPSEIASGTHKQMNWKCQKGHIWRAQVVSRTKGNGCPYCSGRKVIAGQTDLATTHPIIAKRASGWDPTKYSSGSSAKLEWICDLNHKYQSTVAHQTSGESCPYCTGKKVLEGFNDLAFTHPEFATQLTDIDPTTISAGSNKKIARTCSLGHSWSTSIKTLIKGHGCPYCSNTKLLVGFNDLLTKAPEIAKEAYEWDPSTEIFGSMHKRSWMCAEGHIWKTMIQSRVRGTGCPSCAKSGFNPNLPSYLYFLIQEQWEMFQIGITNDLERRLKEHSRNNWKVLDLRGPMDGHLTQQWETAILRMLKAKGADLSNDKIAGKFDGYSEAWCKSTFEVNSIKELMSETELFEDGTT